MMGNKEPGSSLQMVTQERTHQSSISLGSICVDALPNRPFTNHFNPFKVFVRAHTQKSFIHPVHAFLHIPFFSSISCSTPLDSRRPVSFQSIKFKINPLPPSFPSPLVLCTTATLQHVPIRSDPFNRDR